MLHGQTSGAVAGAAGHADTQGCFAWPAALLTAAGQRKTATEEEKWNRMAHVIAGILQTTPEEV